jgi:hypothetical protein
MKRIGKGGRNIFQDIVVRASVLLLTTSVLTAESVSHVIESLPRARAGMSATAVGNKAFFAGSSAFAASEVYVFDAQSWAWSTLQLSQGRALVSATSNGDLVFFGGGYVRSGHHSSTVDIYDTRDGTWSTTNLSVARARTVALSVADKVIFAGGWTEYGLNNNTVDIYDVNTQTWSQTHFPRISSARTGVVLGSKAFFPGDYGRLLDIYDAETGQWSYATLSQSRMLPLSLASGDTVMFAGGYGEPGVADDNSDRVDIYHADTDTWSTASLQIGRWNHAGAVLDGKFYIAGGALERYTLSPTLCTDTVEVYDPETDTWSLAPSLALARCDLAGVSLDGMIIFAGGDREYYSQTYTIVDIYGIPEPATASLLLSGGALLVFTLRRRYGRNE